ncbi:MAG: hypothetical protein JXQ23_09320, partial [Clostridia bacterium]|nr:hypothetical protein [Clostridia bacterium]
MAVVKMNKMALLGLADDKIRILTRLMELGIVEINNIEIDDKFANLFTKQVDEVEISDLDGKINTLTRSLSVISKYDVRKKPMFKVRTDINIHDYRQVIFKRHEVLAKCREIMTVNDDIISLKNDINRSNSTITNLIPWEHLPFSLDYSGTKRTVLYKGTFPVIANIAAIQKEIADEKMLLELNVINEDAEQIYAAVVIFRENEKESLQYLKRNGFSVINFSQFSGSVTENVERIKQEIIELRETILQKESVLEEYARILNEIEIVFDYYSVRKDMEIAHKDIAKSKRVFMLEGWIPEEIVEKTIKELNETWSVDVVVREAYEDEEFPVMLKNGFIGDATEGITAMYSLPNCREADPNTVMAPFYMLFFGLMLSDAGYGLVMALACGFIYLKVKLEESTRRFIKLMMLSGVATIFWGALFGSWFGNFIPILLGDSTRDIAIWFDPVKDPEYLLMWSLLFGVIHVFVGLGMKAYNFIRRKKYLDALFDVVFWYVFFTGAILLVLPVVPGVPATLAEN